METFVIALAEARSLIRGARVWLLAVLAVGAGMATFLHLSIRHYAAFNPNSVPPRLLAQGIGVVVLGVLLLGIVLIASDADARHRREGIADALHCRPCSNLALVAGRFGALLLLGWLIAALYCVLTVGVAWIDTHGAYGEGAVQAFEPWSLVTFAFVDAPAALAFWSALAIALAAVLGRWLAALVALALLGLQGWALHHTPLGVLPLVSTVGDAAAIASDLAPRGVDAQAWTQRIALLIVAGGLLCIAAAAYPRPDATRRRVRISLGAALLGGGLACGIALAEGIRADWREREQWEAVHKSLRNEPRADLRRIAGRVVIAPDALALAVDLHLVRSPGEPADEIMLSLNPGLAVEKVLVDGREVSFRHEHGLLAVRLESASASSPAEGAEGGLVLTVHASGAPTGRFAYLDSVLDASERSLAESRLHILGTEASLFERDYVALMPSARWLPIPGANYPAEGAESPDTGFFQVDLEVGVPAGWLAVGPGRVEPLPRESPVAASDTRSQHLRNGSWFRMYTTAPVSQAAVFAAPFERRSTRIGDVEFAVFLHPRHMAPFHAYDADAIADLTAFVAFGLRVGKAQGFAYPYDVFHLVEVPGRLRTYGSVHIRANTALPGISLLREHAFTTAGKWDRNDDGQLGELRRYFDEDFMGGNPLAATHRHLFGLQTHATGSYGFRLLMEEVASGTAGIWFGGGARDFLGHSFAFAERLPVLGAIVADTAPIRHAWRHQRAVQWELAAGVPLDDADPMAQPRMLPAFARKAEALADQLEAEIGRGKFAVFAELRQRDAFRVEDVQAAAGRHGAEVDIAKYLQAKQSPGFLFAQPKAFRLPDDEQGSPRYQLTLRVYNAEPADGLVQLRYHADTHLENFPFFGEPIAVPGCAALELGMLAADPPTGVSVDPFHSLNREHVFLPVPVFDVEDAVPAEPFVGAKPIDRPDEPDAGVVVDDLEARFDDNPGSAGYLVDALARRWRALTEATEFRDAGIPILLHGPAQRRWYRAATPWAWGRYRHTFAWTPAGGWRRHAVFTATLAAGRWRLDYHLPERKFGGIFAPHQELGRAPRGTLNIQVRDGERSRQVPFDADAATAGWNPVADFDLDAGDVRVHITNQTDGVRVIADAIRWQPADADTAAAFKALRDSRNASRADNRRRCDARHR